MLQAKKILLFNGWCVVWEGFSSFIFSVRSNMLSAVCIAASNAIFLPEIVIFLQTK